MSSIFTLIPNIMVSHEHINHSFVRIFPSILFSRVSFFLNLMHKFYSLIQRFLTLFNLLKFVAFFLNHTTHISSHSPQYLTICWQIVAARIIFQEKRSIDVRCNTHHGILSVVEIFSSSLIQNHDKELNEYMTYHSCHFVEQSYLSVNIIQYRTK